MVKLLWIAAFGYNVALVPEDTTFRDMQACQAFGRSMASRTADYTRGMFKLGWSIEVHVGFHCAIDGQPA